MRRRATLLFLVAAAAAAGCGERAEPLETLPQDYPVRVEGAGDRPTVLGQRPDRVVALDPGSAELLVAMGIGERLVGVPADLSEGPPAAKDVVSPTGQVQVEQVLDLAPELIVATPAVDQVDLFRAERESGAVAYVQPAASVPNVVRGTLELGFLVGEAASARRLAARVQRDVERVEARLAAAAIVPVFVDTGFLITVPERSLIGDLVRRARGRSVAGANPGLEPFGPCKVARLEPKIVLLVVEPGQAAAAPSFAPCPKAGKIRVERIPAELVMRPGPRLTEGLEAIARALHPDAFE